MFDFLGCAIFWGCLGLLIGWNVLPQPDWVARQWSDTVAWIKFKLGS